MQQHLTLINRSLIKFDEYLHPLLKLLTRLLLYYCEAVHCLELVTLLCFAFNFVWQGCLFAPLKKQPLRWTLPASVSAEAQPSSFPGEQSMCKGESVSVWRTLLLHLKHARLGGAPGFEVFLSALLYRAISPWRRLQGFILVLLNTH